MAYKRRVTLKQVARAAGVSTQTVSRVVNNHPDVAPETYERVQRAIKETGYAPNVLARSLIQGRSYTLGVVGYGLDYFGPARVLTGIEHQANELGYSIFLSLLHEPATDNVDYLLQSLLARQVDGIIWAVPEIGANREWARVSTRDLPVPIMFVSGMEDPTSIPLVGVDNHAIGQLATEHLLAGGAQTIGVITGPLGWWEAKERQRGWRETLEAHGVPADDALVATGDWTATSGEQGLYQLLEQRSDIDGIFVSNDQMAVGVLHAAHRLKRRIPDELSIVGVDNIPESAHIWPPLTTVRQRLRHAGTLAVRDLDRMISESKGVKQERNDEPPGTTLLQPELVIRDSSRH